MLGNSLGTFFVCAALADSGRALNRAIGRYDRACTGASRSLASMVAAVRVHVRARAVTCCMYGVAAPKQTTLLLLCREAASCIELEEDDVPIQHRVCLHAQSK